MWKLGFKCVVCEKLFEVKENIVKHDKKRTFMFCSQECYIATRQTHKKGGTVICETCQKEFWVTAGRIRQTAKNGNAIRFCSMKCYKKDGDLNPFWGKKHKTETVVKFMNNPNRHIFQSGKANPNYKRFEYNPHKRKSPEAVRRVMKHEGKKCERCGWDLYPSVLEMHHKDRNHNNNAKENITLICPNCHAVDHFLAKDGKWRKTKKPRKSPPVTYVDMS